MNFHVHVFTRTYFQSSRLGLRSGTAGPYASSTLNLVRTARLFSKAVAPLKIPTAVYEGSSGLLILVIVGLFGFSLLNECDVISHFDYDSLLFIQFGICGPFI